jgi:hypothetical protein
MRRRLRRPPVQLRWLLVVGAVALAGCGSSGSSNAGSSQPQASATASSKPAYCASLENLKASVRAIPGLSEIKQNGTSSLDSALAKVKTNATAVVNDAKTQFKSQTSALDSAIGTLSTSVSQLSKPPTVAQLKALRPQLTAVGTAAQQLKSAVSPKCS